MSAVRARSLQDLVQKMMEVNTQPGMDESKVSGQEQVITVMENLSGTGDNQIISETPLPQKPRPRKAPVLPGEEAGKDGSLLEFSQENLIRGIVFGEILSKPRSLRGRWR